jgi:hypothetical protein
MKIPVRIPLERLLPLPELFRHPSSVHGQRHVGRVMVHAFRLLEAASQEDEGVRLWAAVYLHDLARTHDGRCDRHGEDAVNRLGELPDVRALFDEAGVRDGDYDAIAAAVTHHSRPDELAKDHPHWTLASLLKDADGLDRVRLIDLDVRYLRWPQSKGMAAFAEQLFERTDALPEGPAHFEMVCHAVREIEGGRYAAPYPLGGRPGG